MDVIQGQTVLETVKRSIEEQGIRFLMLRTVDLAGRAKGLLIPADDLEKSLEEGIEFDGSSLELVGIDESDLYLKPDIDSFYTSTYKEEIIGNFFCYIFKPDGGILERDSRWVLRRALDKLMEQGFILNIGAEVEFFLLKGKDKHDEGGYFDLVGDAAVDVKMRFAKSLSRVGIKPEAIHHEVAPGQHEIDFEFSNALKTADSIFVYKEILRNVASEFGLKVTFMPKPFEGINGSGMHLHISLSDLEGKNLFWDPDKLSISDIAKNFIAGLLEHARSLSAFVAPTVNSYKRLVPGYEAPVYICWGHRNRSALVRVPAAREGTCRIEFRAPDPSCNPYLAFTAVLAAGMDGIERNLEPGEPSDWNVYETPEKFETLPSNLKEAIDEARGDEVLRKYMGGEIYKAYLDMLEEEWALFSKSVTDWEVRRYLLRV
ncbi:MAG: hypothetical protein DRN90_05240 [Thermoproteota archaeon]|nr:MAG: hypothetical protein DRN90_05240 [Candidatus Korarchaeota archaeon]